jgi:hypothetical protein
MTVVIWANVGRNPRGRSLEWSWPRPSGMLLTSVFLGWNYWLIFATLALTVIFGLLQSIASIEQAWGESSKD